MKKYKTSLLLSVALWGFLVIYCLSLKQYNDEVINKQNTMHVYREKQFIKIQKENNNNNNNETKETKNKTIFFSLTLEERILVESIVAGESGIEPYWGKVAVASCILNACLLEDKRPEEIQTMYGYAGWKPIEEFESECMAAYGNTDLSDEVRDAVSQVFDNGEVLSNEILWFYAPKYSSGSWHRTQKFVIEISNHRFYAPWN